MCLIHLMAKPLTHKLRKPAKRWDKKQAVFKGLGGDGGSVHWNNVSHVVLLSAAAAGH